MSTIFGPRPDDRPPREEDWSTGVTISIVAHAMLIGALVWGLHWRSSTVVVASSAELWSAVPEAAAPPPVETPPPPPQPIVETPPPPVVESPKPPDIVTEQVKEKKPPPKPVPPKPTPAPPPPPEKMDAKTLARLHQEQVDRMMRQMGTQPGATGNAAHDSGPSASYAGRIIARLKPKLVLTDSIPGNPAVEVTIRCAPDGTIIGRSITQTSGSKAWDDAVLRAIDSAGTLPRDTNGKALDTIPIIWRPQD
jgi:colicin import membrane protein